MHSCRLAKHLKAALLLDLLTAFLLAGCLSPPAADTGTTPEIVITCTLLGCNDTLSLNLAGTIPSDYTLTVIAPNGTSKQVHCVNGIAQIEDKASSENGPECHSWGVSFIDFAPDNLTVTLKWDDHEVSQTLEPKYELDRPNGPDCEPECRIGSAVFTVPPSP